MHLDGQRLASSEDFEEKWQPTVAFEDDVA
jgi:hypothetical protein